jgi:hypothetical protein
MELDEDTLDRLRRFCGRDPREPEMVTRTAFYESGTRYWTAEEFLADISSAVEGIPKDRLADATVELDCDSDYGGHLKITYEELETAEEVAHNLQKHLRYVNEARERERSQYEELKRKFG